MNYDCVIFDFDGTLVDTWPSIHFCMREAFSCHGLDVPDEGAARAAVARGLSLRHTILVLAPDLDDEGVDSCVAIWREAYLDRGGAALASLFPGIPETLAALVRAGVPLAVVSNRKHTAVSATARELGFLEHVRVVAGEGMGLPGKPDPALYHAVIRPALGERPGRVLMVGDSEADLSFAANIGADSCWAGYGYGDTGRCRALRPSHTVPDPAGIIRVVLGQE